MLNLDGKTRVAIISFTMAILLSTKVDSAESGQTVTSCNCGQAKLKIFKLQEGEGHRVQVAIFGSDDKEEFPDLSWPGEFLSLCNTGVFALIDTSTQHRPGLSFLIDSSMKVIARYEFGEVYAFGSSTDGKIFWIQSRSSSEKRPITRLRAFNYHGGEIWSKSYTEGGLESVLYEGRSYEIRVEKPDFPG